MEEVRYFKKELFNFLNSLYRDAELWIYVSQNVSIFNQKAERYNIYMYYEWLLNLMARIFCSQRKQMDSKLHKGHNASDSCWLQRDGIEHDGLRASCRSVFRGTPFLWNGSTNSENLRTILNYKVEQKLENWSQEPCTGRARHKKKTEQIPFGWKQNDNLVFISGRKLASAPTPGGGNIKGDCDA